MKKMRRVLATLLMTVMTVTQFGSATITAYAATGQSAETTPVVSADGAVSETEADHDHTVGCDCGDECDCGKGADCDCDHHDHGCDCGDGDTCSCGENCNCGDDCNCGDGESCRCGECGCGKNEDITKSETDMDEPSTDELSEEETLSEDALDTVSENNIEEPVEKWDGFVEMHGDIDWEWGDVWGECYATCPDCGVTYMQDGCPTAEVAEFLLSCNFCDDCGYCRKDANSECWAEHHCMICDSCVDDDYCDRCKEELDFIVCYDCMDEAEVGGHPLHCPYCGEHFGDGCTECECEYGLIKPHCMDCSDIQCDNCGLCLMVDGEETIAVEGDGCAEHHLCNNCIEEFAGNDGIHCPICFKCDEEICDNCGLCMVCAENEEHCPECGYCFGRDNDIEWCEFGGEGEHCIHCCEENGWLCEQCEECCEGSGKDMCDDCGLCWECCLDNSESAGCSHGYCIESADYEDHLCPQCGECPQDLECEDCGLCEECAQDYHCEHELCPEGFDWDEHVCWECGDCFEPGTLCEWCNRCESCAQDYHCEEHNLCPDDWQYDMGDHFFCDQCGKCFENELGKDRCKTCNLCLGCCEKNTADMGCDCVDDSGKRYCIKSSKFAAHWCFEDERCLSKCTHDEDCTHTHMTTEWESDDNGHWKGCEDCGRSLNMAVHAASDPVIVKDPDPLKRTNGIARISCKTCGYEMEYISVPYTEIPSDGSPYIISQPKDYNGKVSNIETERGPIYYATFTVRAGGDNLKYQWYQVRNGGTAKALVDGKDNWYQQNFGGDKPDVQGAATGSLTIVVDAESCVEYFTYYCVVSNTNGSVETLHAKMNINHWWSDGSWTTYTENPDEHVLVCVGDGCDEIKPGSRGPHTYGEWKVTPATSDKTGKKERSCLLCGHKDTVIIPKVTPGHVHEYNKKINGGVVHWYECSCGLRDPKKDPEEHIWNEGVVTEAATEKKKGEKTYTCTVCNATRKEVIDKLPHTHVWYDYDGKEEHCGGASSSKGHYVKCTGCDQVKWEDHNFSDWDCSSEATASTPGRFYRMCENCGYKEFQHYEYGEYRIWVDYSVAESDPVFAKPGDTVTIKHKKVEDYCWGDSIWGDLAGNPSYSDLKLVAIPGFDKLKNQEEFTFTMPNGSVGVQWYAGTASKTKCKHAKTEKGPKLEPSCTGYGHNPDTICTTCGKVIKEGARIEPLGHDLNSEPDPGTARTEYCYVWADGPGGTVQTIPNKDEKGRTVKSYSGDYTCKRCHKVTSGKYTPQLHGCQDKINYNGHGTSYVDKTQLFHTEDNVDPTCVTDGYEGAAECKWCGERTLKGEKVPRTGHDWGEWTVLYESTPKKYGVRERVCKNDPTHIDRETLPLAKDYTLEADRTKIRFDFAYGSKPQPVTIHYTSVGKERITAITSVSLDNNGDLGCAAEDAYRYRIEDGMSVVIEPNPDYYEEIMEAKDPSMTITVDGVTETKVAKEIFAPKVTVTANIRKSNAKYDLVIENGWIDAVNGISCVGKVDKQPLNAGDLVKLKASKKDFDHWEIISDSSKTIGIVDTSAFVMPANDVTIKGWYESEQCRLIYHSSGDDHTLPSEGKTVEIGGKAKDPKKTVCSYCGKVFSGWYADETYTQLYDFDQCVWKDTDLYGYWTDPVSYVLKFDMKGYGTQIPDQSIVYANRYKAAVPAVPAAEGQTFGGWYMDSACTIPFNFNATISTDMTLYAKWVKSKVNLHTVTFCLDRSTPGDMGYLGSQTVADGKKLTKPADPIDTSYLFSGWYTDAEKTVAYDFKKPVKSDLTLYAKWVSKYIADPYGISVKIDSKSDSVKFNKGLNRYEIVYTGSNIEPTITVTYNYDGKVLKEGTDYTVKYSNNLNVDKKGKPAVLTVTGKGNYKGTKKLNFYILPRSLSEPGVTVGNLVVERGKKPAPVVIYSGHRLDSNKDYTLKSAVYPDLKFTGSDGKLTICGKGNYTGTIADREVEVVDKNLIGNRTIKLVIDQKRAASFMGAYKNGEPKTLRKDGDYTVKRADGTVVGTKYYDLVYENNVNAGTAKVTAIGKDEYAGYVSNTATFKIKPDTTTLIETWISDPKVYYTPAGATPKVCVVGKGNDSADKVLTEGIDYTITWSNNKKATDKAYYTVKFKGNYKGHKAVKSETFTIKPIEFDEDSLSMTIPDMVYTKAGKYCSTPYVTYNGMLLKNGTDYTAQYFVGEKDITKESKYTQEADKAAVTVKITGKGNYNDKIITFKDCYVIRKAPEEAIDLSKVKITKCGNIKKGIPTQTYTGNPVNPSFDVYVKVKEGKKTKWVTAAEAGLKAGTDYDVAYINNVSRGKATVIVKAKSTSKKAVKSKSANYTIGQGNIGLINWFG